MIKDNLQHIDYYNYLSPAIYFGLKYLKNTDFSTMENGKYEISKNKVWAIVQDYNTKPVSDGKFEAHRKFVDIQFIVEGEEQICVGNIDDFDIETEYDEEKDIVFLTPKESARANELYIDTTLTPSPQPSPLKGEGARCNSYSIYSKTELKKVIAGEYMILMPKDAHMPSIAVDSPGFVKKVVLKVII